MSGALVEGKIKKFWGLLESQLTSKDRKDRKLKNLVYSVVGMLYLKSVAHVNNAFLLDLFVKSGFIVTPEFDGKSWVVVA